MLCPFMRKREEGCATRPCRGDVWLEGTRTLLLGSTGKRATRQNGTESEGDKHQRRVIPEDRMTFPGE